MTSSKSEGAVSKSNRQAKQPKFQRSVAYVPVEALDVANSRLNELVTNRLTLQTAISKLYDRIKASLEQGISYEELATALTSSGIQITVTRLKQLLTAEAKARGVSRRRGGVRGNRKASESEKAAGNGSAPMTSTLELTALSGLNGQSKAEASHEPVETAASTGRKRAAKTTKAAASTSAKTATKSTTSKPRRTKATNSNPSSSPAAEKSTRGTTTKRRSSSRKTS